MNEDSNTKRCFLSLALGLFILFDAYFLQSLNRFSLAVPAVSNDIYSTLFLDVFGFMLPIYVADLQ